MVKQYFRHSYKTSTRHRSLSIYTRGGWQTTGRRRRIPATFYNSGRCSGGDATKLHSTPCIHLLQNTHTTNPVQQKDYELLLAEGYKTVKGNLRVHWQDSTLQPAGKRKIELEELRGRPELYMKFGTFPNFFFYSLMPARPVFPYAECTMWTGPTPFDDHSLIHITSHIFINTIG